MGGPIKNQRKEKVCRISFGGLKMKGKRKRKEEDGGQCFK